MEPARAVKLTTATDRSHETMTQARRAVDERGTSCACSPSGDVGHHVACDRFSAHHRLDSTFRARPAIYAGGHTGVRDGRRVIGSRHRAPRPEEGYRPTRAASRGRGRDPVSRAAPADGHGTPAYVSLPVTSRGLAPPPPGCARHRRSRCARAESCRRSRATPAAWLRSMSAAIRVLPSPEPPPSPRFPRCRSGRGAARPSELRRRLRCERRASGTRRRADALAGARTPRSPHYFVSVSQRLDRSRQRDDAPHEPYVTEGDWR